MAWLHRGWAAIGCSAVLMIAGCSTPPRPSVPPTPTPPPLSYPALDGSSRWVAANWADLPGFADDDISQAWGAWVYSCSRPLAAFASLCPQIRALTIADAREQRAWLQAHLQPYRIENTQGEVRGMLTSYYEPVFQGQRLPGGRFVYPLYATPIGWSARSPWYSRQEADTLPQAQAALRGRAIAYLDNPVDPLVLQVQGSGQLRLQEADGSSRMVRLAYAGTNQKPYQSVSRWLAANTSLRNYSWAAIKAWAQDYPEQATSMAWSNPRMVFFKEEALPAASAEGPRGAQGVPLSAGRSIAVDPGSIPYGSPVWLSSSGSSEIHRLVLAQDTGSAIRGAVRADFYAGSGPEAGEFANRIKQSLLLWVLWPKSAALP